MRDVIRSSFSKAALVALALGYGPLPVSALEFGFAAPGASDSFEARLRDASLSLSTARLEGSTALDLLAAAQADYGRLVGVLYAQGFYSGSVNIRVNGQEAASIPPLRAPERIDRIDIIVERGPAFAFGRARVAPLAPGTKLPEGFATGLTAEGELIGQAARAGISAWRDAGHAKAEVAGLPTGRVYSPAERERAANRLRRTGAFRSVVMRDADTPNPDGTLDIATQVVDAKRRRIGAGAELSSLEGITLSGFWLHRNLLGGAERLRLDAMIGGIGGDSGGEDFRLGARLDRPATFTPDTGAFLLANIEDNNEPDYSESKAEIGGGLTHIFSDELTGEAGITYRYSEITDDLGNRELQHLLFPLRATWDRRDDPLNPTSGLYLDVSLTPFIGLDDGGGAGARFYVDLREHVSFGANDRFTLAGRAQLGSVTGADIEDVPADMLFYSGGAGTVRGQQYQSLGVDQSPTVTIGGRAFLGFSGEVRTMVSDSIQAVAFADTGFIGQDAFGTGRGEWHSGAGIGARYFTAVGPIRVDLATPIGENAGENLELYIGIGQAF